MNRTSRQVTIFLSIFLFVCSAVAQASIRNKLEVFKEIEVLNDKGVKETKLVKPDVAVPGDEIVNVITFTNIGKEVASGIVITNPLPNNSVYKKGSAFGAGTDITFSVDGGKTYKPISELKIKGVDGELRAAKPTDYTDIKWIFKNELKPSDEGTVTYRTVVTG